MGDTINPSIVLNIFSIVKTVSINFFKTDDVIFNLFYFLYSVFSSA